MEVTPAYLRQKQAAALLSMSVQGLLKHHRTGDGPPRIVKGRAVYYSIKDLNEWMARDREQPVASGTNDHRRVR
jgi:hypothetical protein